MLAKHVVAGLVSACKSAKSEITCRIYIHRTGCFGHKELCKATTPNALNLVQLKRQATPNSSFHSCHCSDTRLQGISSSLYFPVSTKTEEVWKKSACLALSEKVLVRGVCFWPLFRQFHPLCGVAYVYGDCPQSCSLSKLFLSVAFLFATVLVRVAFFACLLFFDLPTVTYSMHSSLMQVNGLPKSVKQIFETAVFPISIQKNTHCRADLPCRSCGCTITKPAWISLEPEKAHVAICVLYVSSWSRCIVLMPVHTIQLQFCDYICWFNRFGCDNLGFIIALFFLHCSFSGIRLGRVSGFGPPSNVITFNKQIETDRKQDTAQFHVLIPHASLSNPRDILQCCCIGVVITVIAIHSLLAMPAMLPLILAVAAVKCLAECQTEEHNLLSCWGSWTWQRLFLNNAFWTILLSFTMVYFGTDSFRKEFLNISTISPLENNLTGRFKASNLDGIEIILWRHQPFVGIFYLCSSERLFFFADEFSLAVTIS